MSLDDVESTSSVHKRKLDHNINDKNGVHGWDECNFDTLYEFEPDGLSDVTVVVQEEYDACFKCHKAILTRATTYFDTVIPADLSNDVITLPNTFSWTSTQLLQGINLLYGLYDTEIQSFIGSSDVNQLHSMSSSDILLYKIQC